MSEVRQAPPAGWYLDAQGVQRWWDGRQWGAPAQVVVVREPKSLVATYLLWFFLGGLGVHHFYTGNVGAGVAMLALNVIGWILAAFIIGWFLLAVFLVWWIIDAFLIPGYVTAANR